MAAPTTCPVCNGATTSHDRVDFSKSCVEAKGIFLPASGLPIEYRLCRECGFCFSPTMYRWTVEQFKERVYNDAYSEVDPDHIVIRPVANADALRSMFPDLPSAVSHLDYGGGFGLLSDLMRDSGWHSKSYDPFLDQGLAVPELGKFDFITAFEVFEHVPDVNALISDLGALLAADGVILFSTLLSDGEIAPNKPLTWWYAGPRNGHISLFSKKSLDILADRAGFSVASSSNGTHAFWRTVPAWARHLLPGA
jgi:SAM-dependent methyltransferase